MDLVSVVAGVVAGALVTTALIVALMFRTGASSPAIETLDDDERDEVSRAIVDAVNGGTGIIRMEGGQLRRLDPSDWILIAASNAKSFRGGGRVRIGDEERDLA